MQSKLRTQSSFNLPLKTRIVVVPDEPPPVDGQEEEWKKMKPKKEQWKLEQENFFVENSLSRLILQRTIELICSPSAAKTSPICQLPWATGHYQMYYHRPARLLFNTSHFIVIYTTLNDYWRPVGNVPNVTVGLLRSVRRPRRTFPIYRNFMVLWFIASSGGHD